MVSVLDMLLLCRYGEDVFRRVYSDYIQRFKKDKIVKNNEVKWKKIILNIVNENMKQCEPIIEMKQSVQNIEIHDILRIIKKHNIQGKIKNQEN